VSVKELVERCEKSEYHTRLKAAVEKLHGCHAEYFDTVPVHEVFQRQTVWQGDVEVFDLTGHPRQAAYAWSHPDGVDDFDERFHAVLEIPPWIQRPPLRLLSWRI